MNTARKQLMGAGTTTAGLAFGGLTPPSVAMAQTEEWNEGGPAILTVGTE